ncbi:MAG: hypothetical protein K6A30_03140 [Lachnospiraceae bacterium]|nr:hypothetical protein [Lachnospiraceae bacterium]
MKCELRGLLLIIMGYVCYGGQGAIGRLTGAGGGHLFEVVSFIVDVGILILGLYFAKVLLGVYERYKKVRIGIYVVGIAAFVLNIRTIPFALTLGMGTVCLGVVLLVIGMVIAILGMRKDGNKMLLLSVNLEVAALLFTLGNGLFTFHPRIAFLVYGLNALGIVISLIGYFKSDICIEK